MNQPHGSNPPKDGHQGGPSTGNGAEATNQDSGWPSVQENSETPSSNGSNSNGSSSPQLMVPDQQSTAQARRKRGLSLRSQLFNKALSSRLISPSLFDVSVEMDDYDKKQEQPSNLNVADTIQEGASSGNNTRQTWSDMPSKHLSPYSTHAAQISSESITSDTSSVEFLPRKRSGISSAFTFLRDKIFGPPPPTPPNRVIPISYESTGDNYVNNLITSSKYTVYSFLPQQLRAQFSKVANVYFLCVAIMQMIPSWSTTGQFTTIIPLSIFISISIAREGFDDWRRHRMDREENNRTAHRLVEPGSGPSIIVTDIGDTSDSTSDIYSTTTSRNIPPLVDTKWKDVKVGDILRIPCDLAVPADILVLNTEPLINMSTSETEENDSEAVAYIETMDLDGETNLKPRQAPAVSYNGFYHGTATVENPNLDLYNFEGVLTTGLDSIPVGPENVIYRGSIVRNTNAIIGLVIFTGEETKIRMNNIKNPRTKAPKLQRAINIIVLFMVVVVASLSAFSLMAQKILYLQNYENAWYLYNQDVGTAATLFGFIIMYNTLIPLSLYVTMEIIKLGQLLLLQYDIDMYHKESNTPADAKTATILEELGQVGYVFSDKTGTLTENKMVFRGLTVGGTAFYHNGEPLNEKVSNLDTPNTSINPENLKLTTEHLLEQINSPSIFASKAKFFLLCIALCSTAVPRRSGDDVTYLASSPDEKALVEAARDLGYVVWDKNRLILTLKTYPHGLDNSPQVDEYTVLEVVEFLSARKRMSILVKFPDDRICVICKGADTIVMDLLQSRELATRKAHELAVAANQRKQEQADVVILDRLSRDGSRFSREGRFSLEGGTFSLDGTRFSHESRSSLGSLRRSIQLDSRAQTAATLLSLDQVVSEVNDVAIEARRSLQLDQERRYQYRDSAGVLADDRLVLNEEFVLEKTLQHVEEFSTEGLRTLVYGSRWLDQSQYDEWIQKYRDARTALSDRAEQVEKVGSEIENNLELVGATAIEDKLQDGVPDAINKLRLAGIKMWMLTGDKRETAINIGYSCGLIKDYSTVVVLDKTLGLDPVRKEITTTTNKINGGSIAHCVVVIDGATLGSVQAEDVIMTKFVDLCLVADLAICCRASPSQKAAMVSAVRVASSHSIKQSIKSPFKPGASTGVTLAIGDGANDIAMIQSADIGVGITGKEGLQAARSADYAIAQFRFIVKLLLVHGRYNYVRTLKFVLCTFYKELIFYLTQCCYQKWTLFSGLSVYESWSLSMYNTLFTSLCVLVVGIFDRDLHAATLIAVPQLYATGRESQLFNFWVFVRWMIGAAIQSVAISFMSWYFWALTALKDNTTLGLGTGLFGALVIIINTKCVFIETQNRTWLSFAAFIISVGGYGIWNVLIMFLYRSNFGKIFYVEYGLYHFAQDSTWWAMVLALSAIPLYADILVKVGLFVFSPSDVAIFQSIEKDMEFRANFEKIALPYLSQGWTCKEPTHLKKWVMGVEQRKRAGTETNPQELPPSGDGVALYSDYEVLPSGKKFKRKKDDIEAILRDRDD